MEKARKIDENMIPVVLWDKKKRYTRALILRRGEAFMMQIHKWYRGTISYV